MNILAYNNYYCGLCQMVIPPPISIIFPHQLDFYCKEELPLLLYLFIQICIYVCMDSWVFIFFDGSQSTTTPIYGSNNRGLEKEGEDIKRNIKDIGIADRKAAAAPRAEIQHPRRSLLVGESVACWMAEGLTELPSLEELYRRDSGYSAKVFKSRRETLPRPLLSCCIDHDGYVLKY